MLNGKVLSALQIAAYVSSVSLISAAQYDSSLPPDPVIVEAIRQQLDLSRLSAPRLTRLPAESSAYSSVGALSCGNLERIMPEGESFDAPAWSADEAESLSRSFVCEVQPARGSILLTLRDDVDPVMPAPVPGGDAGFLSDARSRMETLGLPRIEIAGAFVRHLKRASRAVESSQVVLATIGTKVFVDRSLGGVSVLGSRIVVSYDAAGSLRKFLGHWPSLARSGHRLSTRLTTSQVGDEVALQLAGMSPGSIPPGRIPLRYVYQTDRLSDGTVALTLMVEATLPVGDPLPGATTGGKIRQALLSLSS